MIAQDPMTLFFASLVAAPLAGALLHRFGGRELKLWAMPAGAAIVAAGAGHAFELPNLVVAGAFLGALFLFHKSVKARVESAARSVDEVALGDSGWTLKRFDDPSGAYAAVWKTVEVETAGELRALGPEAEAAARDPLIVGFAAVEHKEGEVDGVFRADVPKFQRGMVVAHHARARGDAARLLADKDPLTELPGQGASLVIRSVPPDLGFALFDIKTIGAMADLLEFDGPDAEVSFSASGKETRLSVGAVMDGEVLRKMLPLAVRLFLRVREVGKEAAP